MTNPRKSTMFRAFLVAPAAAGLLFLGGCPKQEEQKQQTVTEAPPPPRDPWAEITLDSRVEFPHERSPKDEALLKAVVDLANAIAKGDDAGVNALLSRRDQSVLQDLVQHGEWKSQTQGIELVRVCTLSEEEGKAKLGLGIQDNRGAYLLAFEGMNNGGQWNFSGLAVAPKTASAAKDLDGSDLTVRAVVVAAAPEKPLARPERKKPDEQGGQSSGSGPGGIQN